MDRQPHTPPVPRPMTDAGTVAAMDLFAAAALAGYMARGQLGINPIEVAAECWAVAKEMMRRRPQ